MYKFLIKAILLPVSDFLLGYSVSKEFKKHTMYSQFNEQELYELQNSKLEAIIDHALDTVPAYTNYSSINRISPELDIQNFPILTKSMLQGKELSYVSRIYDHKKLLKLESSGSSGIKTKVFLTKKEHSILRAILINWWSWTGYYLGKPILQTGITPNRGLLKGLKDFLTRTYYCDAFALTETDAIKTLQNIARKKPRHLGGFASSLYILATVAEKNDIKVTFEGAISWGDKLFDHYKLKIEEVFSTTVYENYGCNEGLMIGQKVDLDYFYIYTPNVYIEIVDDNGNAVDDGEMGRVIATKLDGYAMPMLRYDTGDLAIKLPRSEYPHKRRFKFPLLKKVIGRNTDIIKTPEGKNLIVHTFTGIFEFFDEIKQFRIIQEKIDSIDIEYIIGNNFDDSVVLKIEEVIRKRTGTLMNINWKRVETIESTSSGKPQIIENRLVRNSLAHKK